MSEKSGKLFIMHLKEVLIMHIVFVTTELATMHNVSGGLASFTSNMARICVANRHRVTIILSTVKEESLTFDDDIMLEKIFVKKQVWDALNRATKICIRDKKENANEARKFLVNIYRSGQVRKRIKEINKREKIDIVHYCNLCALAFRASKYIPYVIRISGFDVMCKGADLPDGKIDYDVDKLSIKDKLVDYTVKKARYVISPSNLLADEGRKTLGIDATVIESPFLLSKTNWDYSIYNSLVGNKKYIIHYGRLGYLKGTHIVAEIANEVLHKFPDIYLVLVGSNGELLDENGGKVKSDKLVKKRAGDYSDRVIYAGVLVREQLYPLIEKAELCLLPSRIENLPNACIEAMSMGQIVVGTNGASFEQLIDDKKSGFLCERDNPDSYFLAIDEALNMSIEEKNEMKSEAREVTERLKPQKIYEKYVEFYEKIIEEW